MNCEKRAVGADNAYMVFATAAGTAAAPQIGPERSQKPQDCKTVTFVTPLWISGLSETDVTILSRKEGGRRLGLLALHVVGAAMQDS